MQYEKVLLYPFPSESLSLSFRGNYYPDYSIIDYLHCSKVSHTWRHIVCILFCKVSNTQYVFEINVYVLVICSSSLLSNISLNDYITFCLPILLLMDIWTIFSVLLWVKLSSTFLCKNFCEHLFPFILLIHKGKLLS